MDIILSFLICIIATTAGAISGIGGGIIIKPVLDAASGLPAATISFLSGCTVLSMSIVSLLRSRGTDVKIDRRRSTLLAVGAAIGGVLGKQLFNIIQTVYGNDNMLGVIQSVIILLMTVGVLVYVLNKVKIHTIHLDNSVSCVLIGLMLGLLSAFLGIGGGPINLAVLYYFFSMDTKTAALNSIYIILFSQITSFASTFMTDSVPDFKASMLAVMIIGGIFGGFLGRSITQKISNTQVDLLFRVILVCIIMISCYNVYHYAV